MASNLIKVYLVILVCITGIITMSYTSALTFSPTPITLQSGWNYFGAVFNHNITISLLHGYNLIGMSSVNDVNVQDVFYNGLIYSEAKSQGNITGINNTINTSINGDEATTLEKGKVYWVYVNDARGGSLTLPNAGGNAAGESYSFADLTFSNGTTELNISEALSKKWITSSIYRYVRYGAEMCEDLGGCYISLSSRDTFTSWKGYFLYGLKNNVTMIRQDGEIITILNKGWNSFALNNNPDRTIPLYTGNNLIGISTRKNLNIDSLRFSNGTDYNYSEAKSNGLIYSVNETSGNEATQLTSMNAYWIKAIQNVNMTFLNAGGSQVGDNFLWRNVQFANSTDKVNITQAYNNGWIGSTFFFYNSSTHTSVPISIALLGNKQITTYTGYQIYSNLNNIQMIFDEKNYTIPPQPPLPCTNGQCKPGKRIGVGKEKHTPQIVRGPQKIKIGRSIEPNQEVKKVTVLPGVIILRARK